MKKSTEEHIKDLSLQILQLTELQNLCVKLKKFEHEEKQDNSELLALLKKNYRLTPEEISTITLTVEGKIKVKTVGDDFEILERLLHSYCVICNINEYEKKDKKDDKNKFIGLDKLSSKCSNKKSILNKELKKLEEKKKLLNKESEESSSEELA